MAELILLNGANEVLRPADLIGHDTDAKHFNVLTFRCNTGKNIMINLLLQYYAKKVPVSD